jgi:hypothetical protein
VLDHEIKELVDKEHHPHNPHHPPRRTVGE